MGPVLKEEGAMLCPYCGNNVWGSTGYCEICSYPFYQQSYQFYGQQMQGYQQPYGYYQQPQGQAHLAGFGQPYATGNYVIAIILGVVALLSVACTFLPWISVGGSGGVTGLQIMTTTGQGFFMFRWGGGSFFFTGFWSIVLGAVLVLPVILAFLEKPKNWLYILTGSLTLVVAVLDIVMVYTKFKGGGLTESAAGMSISVNAGIGLWLLLACAVITIVCGVGGYSFAPPRM